MKFKIYNRAKIRNLSVVYSIKEPKHKIPFILHRYPNAKKNNRITRDRRITNSVAANVKSKM